MEVSPRYQSHARTRSLFGRGNANPQPGEDSSTDAESRSRRKFQRAVPKTDDDASAFRKPSLPASAMKQNIDPKASLVQRKRSIGRDARPLHGPRPFDNGGKRTFSEGMKPDLSRRAFLPPSSSMPVLDQTTAAQHRLNPNLSTRPSLDTSQSFSFLPPVNFDDFQSSIASYETATDPDFSPFPSTSLLDTPANKHVDMNSFPTIPASHQPPYLENHAPPRTSSIRSRPPLAETLASRRQMSSPTKQVLTASGDTGLAIRSRRLSALPTGSSQLSSTPAATSLRSPRKSVGPGLLGNMLRERQAREEEQLPTLSAPNQQGPQRVSPTGGRSRARTVASQARATAPIEQSRATAPTKSSKAKSMLPPPRQHNTAQQNDPVTPGDSHRRARSSSRPAVGRQQHLREATPSSSGTKRQSGRMSGLGARTISPTDARRLKRMSMMPNPMPTNKPSPTLPHLEPMPDMRTTARSPSMIPRKSSLTPSSARGTPDSNTQYYTSASSLSRSSSFQSLRAGNNTAMPRMAQSPSLSRLPTPRARNVYSSADTQDEEIVPPVPAIPKAYESPKDQVDTPFFTSAKMAFNEQSQVTPGISIQPALGFSLQPPPVAPEQPTSDSKAEPNPVRAAAGFKMNAPTTSEYQHFSRPSINSTRPSMEGSRPNVPETPAPKKKALQPMRLPPLSLQPLSTPTAARIAALPHPSQELDERETTPPPRHAVAKTPSTPMTASKATYPVQRRYDDESKPSYGLRSSTSHHAIRGAVDHNAFDQFATTKPMPIPESNKRIITPFMSGSLPKTSAEYMPAEKPSSDEYTLGPQDVRAQSSKPQGPRPRAFSKPTRDGPANSVVPLNDGAETPSSGTGLRRKFSLSWRRSASKNADRHATDDGSTQIVPDMPTPVMPASATWTDHLDSPTRKTPTGSTRSSLDSRRRPSQATISSVNTNESTTKPDPAPITNGRLAYRPMYSQPALAPAVTPRSSSWSVSGQARVAATLAKPPLPDMKKRMQNGIPVLDKDDHAADEEMRRLSMKRKEVDAAARVTDELKKRATPKQRLTPAQAIQSSASVLNIYEKGEIIDYKEGVYFCGSKTAKKHVGDISAAGTTNFGYDDERGDYNICLGDHLAYRFEVVDVLGKGSFGQVLRCIDHKLGELVAIKIIRNKKRFHQQALVEINILNKLKEWDPDGAHSTLTVTSSFYFRSHLCIVTPCLSINLYELIKEHSFQGFSLQLIRRISRQLLACLVLLQSKRIIHCDLKPENILLSDPRRADVRVIDFGSSCKTDEKVYTYIQSRFYRSPEVILGSEYGLGIDMWSFGCILAELYTGYPIFPGENEQEQLACIMEIFGPPSRDIIEKCTRRKLFFDSTWKPRVTVSSKGRRRRPSSKTLNVALKCDDDAFIDFLTLCLRWDPEKRLRADQALNHPFITNEPMRMQPSFDRARVRAGGLPQPRPLLGATGGIPSPTKRTVPSTTAPVSGALSSQTPARSRPLPQTPSTAVRGGPVGTALPRAQDSKGSPVKSNLPSVRRQSSLMPEGTTMAAGVNTTGGATSAAGTKRAADGSGLPRMSSGRVLNGAATVAGAQADLASAAARESMGVGTGGRLR